MTPITITAAKMYLKMLMVSFKMNLPSRMENTGMLNLMTVKSPSGIMVTAANDAVVFDEVRNINVKTCHGWEGQSTDFQPL